MLLTCKESSRKTTAFFMLLVNMIYKKMREQFFVNGIHALEKEMDQNSEAILYQFFFAFAGNFPARLKVDSSAEPVQNLILV